MREYGCVEAVSRDRRGQGKKTGRYASKRGHVSYQRDGSPLLTVIKNSLYSFPSVIESTRIKKKFNRSAFEF